MLISMQKEIAAEITQYRSLVFTEEKLYLTD